MNNKEIKIFGDIVNFLTDSQLDNISDKLKSK